MQARHLLFFEHAFVLDRHNLDKVLDVAVPVVEHTSCQGRACVQIVLTNQLQQFFARYAVLNQREFNHIHVAEVVECVIGVVNIGHATTHTGSKVSACLTQHYHTSASHILAAVVAGTFNHSDGTRVTHSEALTYLTIYIEFARCSTVKSGVTCDNIFFGLKVVAATSRRQNRDTTA